MANPVEQSVAQNAKSSTSWSQVWQLPVLLIGLGLLGVGVFLAYPRHEAPDFDAMLDTVQTLFKAEQFEQARERLDLMDLEGIATKAEAPVLARHRQYVGDYQFFNYAELYPVPVDTPESRVALNKIISAYEEAESLGRKLTPAISMERWAEALVLLGRDDDALAVVDRMGEEGQDSRYEIIKTLIERHRARDGSDPKAFVRLIDRFERELRHEKNKPRQLKQRQWVVKLKARHLIEVRDPQRAIDYINREMQRLRAAGAGDEPAILVLLAQAYQDIADFENARRLYALVQQMIDDSDALNGRVLVGLAQIELAVGGEGFEDRALVLFSRSAKEHPTGEAYIDALIGRAHVEAMLQRVTDAVDHFRLAVARLVEDTPPWDPRRTDVTQKLSSNIERAIDFEAYEDALDYLTLLLPLYEDGKTLPAELLLQFAQIHEKIGEQRKADAEKLDPLTWAGPGDPPVAARRNAFQDAAMHFARSAAYYKRHADTVTVIDDVAHGKSLWAAGENYDRAQDWNEAIDIYAEYVATRPGDGEQLKAKHFLAKAYLADRQYGPSIDIFKELIESNPQSNWAYESLVPLARAYTSDGQEDAAVRTLLGIVDGHPGIRPDSETYREALVDLARTYYVLGQKDPVYFVSAIERLNTAVERYGHTNDGPVLRYMLGDSLRRSTEALGEKAEQARSDRQRLAFEAERTQRLRDAEMFYDQVVTELEARFDSARSPLENLYLRNAYFYKADCAYERRDFSVAIDRYREAAQRWAEHPASLVAQVQIVNAHCERGEFQQAYVANQNALWQLSQMPDEAFDSPDMPMTRKHWEDWLRWSSELKILDKQSASATR